MSRGRMSDIPWAEAIRRRRLELGLTQEALAQRCGTTQSTVQRWERGSLPSFDQILSLAAALQWTADEVLRAGATYSPAM